MNADKLNMIAGCAIGALLVFLLIGFFGGQIFGTRGGHHGGEEELAFAVEIEEVVVEDDPDEVDLVALVASADAAKGAKVFSKCKSCHKLADGENGVGPHLYGIVGRKIAAVGGYGYSDVLNGMSEEDWGLENLSAFLEDPKGWAPGTKMGFAGISKPEDRVNLIVYLNEDDGTPIELAAAPATTATDASEDDAAAEEADASEDAATEDTTAEDPAATEEVEEAAPSEDEASGADAATDEDAEAETEATEDEDASLDTGTGEEQAASDDAAQTEETAAVVEAPATDEGMAEETASTDEAEGAGGDEIEVAAVEPEAEAPEETAAEEPAAEEPAAVEAAEEETEVASAVAGGGEFSDLIAAVSLKKGKKIFRKCRACHKVEEGKNGVGPSLWGIVGRPIGALDGFSYSDAMADKGGNWSVSELMEFIQAPNSYLPGTKMSFAGVKDPQDRMNVIAYLNEEDGSPEPLQ